MKKFLALGLLGTFFLAPAVEAQDWHRAGGRGLNYHNHRHHPPVRGHYNFQGARPHGQMKWDHWNYQRGWQYQRWNPRAPRWGYDRYRWGYRNWPHRSGGWGYAQPDRRFFHPWGRMYSGY